MPKIISRFQEHDASASPIHLRDVTMRYNGVSVLEEINAEIPAGERIAIVGPNGAGKTTLIKLIAGLIEARSCERFQLLRDHLNDPELANFYGGLFESEARHHAAYVRLAGNFADQKQVLGRLDYLAQQEALIIAKGDPTARMHS